MTRTTLLKIENGDSGVTFGAYASVLFCPNLEDELLLLAKDNTLGRKLQDISLSIPKKQVAKKQ